WNQDTYPEVLASVGLLAPRSLTYRLCAAVQHWATARVDDVVALDRGMADLLRRQGARRVAVIPNWDADPTAAEAASGTALAEVLRKAKADFRYLVAYTGNYGWGHDLGALFEYLRARPGQRDFFFLFVGGGEKWPQLEAFRREHANGCMAVMGYAPRP